MKLPRRIGYKATDGRMFIIDTIKENINTDKQLHEHIAKLRKEHGYPEPTFMTIQAANPIYQADAEALSNATMDDIKPEYRKKAEQVIEEGQNRPDPKTLN